MSLNAWAALQSLAYDGWVIRFANGYTKRANSVSPLYPSTRYVEDKIKYCERLFEEKGLPTVFKMTVASQPEGLDEELAARNYRVDSFTSVQFLDLHEWKSGAGSPAPIAEAMTPAWFAAYWRMSGHPQKHESAGRQLVANIVPAKAFASVQYEGNVIACGLGVIQEGYLGLFDIVTDPNFRRQGFGRQVVQALLDWGRRHGAHTAYLQVVLDNAPALELYAREGFCEGYRYWYRIKA